LMRGGCEMSGSLTTSYERACLTSCGGVYSSFQTRIDPNNRHSRQSTRLRSFASSTSTILLDNHRFCNGSVSTLVQPSGARQQRGSDQCVHWCVFRSSANSLQLPYRAERPRQPYQPPRALACNQHRTLIRTLSRRRQRWVRAQLILETQIGSNTLH